MFSKNKRGSKFKYKNMPSHDKSFSNTFCTKIFNPPYKWKSYTKQRNTMQPVWVFWIYQLGNQQDLLR